ncbi:MAG TPA: sugar ABC transporter substrate-binding protein [bacterium]|nr:sugar ABC transporter substrate-binding protein [bacterium]
MKRFLLIALMVMIAFSGALTCTERAKKVKIGVSMALFDDAWLTYVREEIVKWGTAHQDVELTIVDAKNDPAIQTGQVENFLAQKMDAIVIMPPDASAVEPITRMVTAAKVPLVYLNRQVENLPPGVIYVGSRSIDAGVFEMTELGRLMGGKGNIVIMMGELAHEASRNRTAGIKQVITEKYPDIKILAEQTANWKRDEGKTLMENWLASGMEIAGVASTNDEMALGALLAIKAAGKLGRIRVCGVDGSDDALASMDRGELDCTVFQDPKGQAEEGINAAYLMALGKPNPKVKNSIIWVPYQLVTKANYQSFMKK